MSSPIAPLSRPADPPFILISRSPLSICAVIDCAFCGARNHLELSAGSHQQIVCHQCRFENDATNLENWPAYEHDGSYWPRHVKSDADGFLIAGLTDEQILARISTRARPSIARRAGLVVGIVLGDLVLAEIIAHRLAQGVAAPNQIAPLIAVALAAVTVTLLKGHLGALIAGVLTAGIWGIGVLILLIGTLDNADPESVWARTFYSDKKLLASAKRFTKLQPRPTAITRCRHCGDPFAAKQPGRLVCDACRGCRADQQLARV